MAVFVDAWTTNAASVTQKLRQRSIASKQVRSLKHLTSCNCCIPTWDFTEICKETEIVILAMWNNINLGWQKDTAWQLGQLWAVAGHDRSGNYTWLMSTICKAVFGGLRSRGLIISLIVCFYKSNLKQIQLKLPCIVLNWASWRTSTGGWVYRWGSRLRARWNSQMPCLSWQWRTKTHR